MITNEEGQGLVEYALILALVAVVVIVMGVLLGPTIGNIFKSTPAQPPAMNAPLLDIVRWCEPLARDSYTTPSTSFTKVGKVMVPMTTQVTHYKDAPDKFIACMQSYEYSVKR